MLIRTYSQQIESLINYELQKVCDWLNANKLTINAKKSNFVIFRPSAEKKLSYQIDNKQLLDEVEHDIMNYQNRGLCYLPKPKAEADNTDTRF